MQTYQNNSTTPALLTLIHAIRTNMSRYTIETREISISDKFYLYILGSIMKQSILLLVVIGIACGKRVFTEPELQITKATIGSC